VRKHASSTRFTDQLFEVFNDDEISWDAAKALGEIASPDPILIKRHHAVIKVIGSLSPLAMGLRRSSSDFACPEIREWHPSTHHRGSTRLEQYVSFVMLRLN
jgi:hypothetical protein